MKFMLLRYLSENIATLLFLLMTRALNFGASFIFSISEGIKKRATARETERFIMTTAAKSARVILTLHRGKK